MNETIQLINTAILKSRDLKIDTDLQERMTKISESPVMTILDSAFDEYSKKQKTTKDQAAFQIISTIRELDDIWTQYLLLEGSDRLKEKLNS